MLRPLAGQGGSVEGIESRLDACRMPVWYSSLAADSFPTVFVKLRPEERSALAGGESSGAVADAVLPRLDHAMRSFPGNRFVSVDLAAPTDTERFREKRGAVRSAGSAWRCLAESAKVRHCVSMGLAECICVRPFRRMDQTREFRLFVKGRELRAMSQYWLLRHFRRLEGRKDLYWELAKEFVGRVGWCLPAPDIAIDVYFTSAKEIIVVDLNPWGPPTDPLMLHSWDHDWSQELGLKLIAPPLSISGDVNVSF
jgi:hypothetical protein